MDRLTSDVERLRLGQVSDATEAARTLAKALNKIISSSNDASAAALSSFPLRDANALLRTSLHTVDRQRNVVLAPISRLNNDILRNIFLAVCEVDDFALSQGILRSALAIRITHVCHKWRVVGIDTARLWTDILFIPGFPRSSQGPACLLSLQENGQNPYQTMNQEFLGRSKAAGLDILCHVGRAKRSRPALSLLKTFVRIVPPRLSSLEITLPRAQDLVQLLHDLPDGMKGPKRFWVFFDDLSRDHHILGGTQAINYTQIWEEIRDLFRSKLFHLEDLVLRDVSITSLFHGPPCPFQDLRDVDMAIIDLDPHSLVAALQSSPRLQSLTLRQLNTRRLPFPLSPSYPPPREFLRVVMANIVILVLTGSATMLEIVLTCIAAPSLNALQITREIDNAADDGTLIQSITSFLQVSGSNVKSLCFHHISPDSCAELLTWVPCLEQLIWSRGPRTKFGPLSLFRLLMPDPSSLETIACPSLKTLSWLLKLSYDISINFPLDICLEMILSRLACASHSPHTCTPLRRLELAHPVPDTEDSHRLLKELALNLDELVVQGWKLDGKSMTWSREKVRPGPQLTASLVPEMGEPKVVHYGCRW